MMFVSSTLCTCKEVPVFVLRMLAFFLQNATSNNNKKGREVSKFQQKTWIVQLYTTPVDILSTPVCNSLLSVEARQMACEKWGVHHRRKVADQPCAKIMSQILAFGF